MWSSGQINGFMVILGRCHHTSVRFINSLVLISYWSLTAEHWLGTLIGWEGVWAGIPIRGSAAGLHRLWFQIMSPVTLPNNLSSVLYIWRKWRHSVHLSYTVCKWGNSNINRFTLNIWFILNIKQVISSLLTNHLIDIFHVWFIKRLL